MNNKPGFILMDLAGLSVSAEELNLLQHPFVAGVVLFRRNFESKKQLKSLTEQLQQIKPMVVAVDQEGGRVQRFRPEFIMQPAMRHWGEIYQDDPELAKSELQNVTQQAIAELQQVGVNLNLMPVLDIDRGKSQVIGGRSFYFNEQVVTDLAQVMITAMQAMGMPATGKHFPGHGFVASDSHLQLPEDDRPWQAIYNEDLQPFAKLAQSLDAIMPAHLLYPKVDAMPAGFSKFWLTEVLRQQLKFKGVIMSDDLSMQGAVQACESISERAQLALGAGCDMLLVCNDQVGLVEVLDNLCDDISQASADRMRQFLSKIRGLN